MYLPRLTSLSVTRHSERVKKFTSCLIVSFISFSRCVIPNRSEVLLCIGELLYLIQADNTMCSVKKRKQSAYKPGSVLLHSCLRSNVVQRLSFICAYCCQQTIAVYPPARASSPQAPVYMTLQLPERTAQDVTTPTGGLLPHLLTLTSPERGGYFLLRYPCRRRHLAH